MVAVLRETARAFAVTRVVASNQTARCVGERRHVLAAATAASQVAVTAS